MIGEHRLRQGDDTMYALGWIAFKGAQNIRGMAMLQLLLGNIQGSGGGMNALRGFHPGLTDVGLMSNLIPYLAMPRETEPDFATYVDARQQALRRTR